MPTFEEKYSTKQKEAAAVAYLDRRIRPARRVVELAARGELQLDGETLEPYDISEDTVRQAASKLKRGRNGTAKTGLTDAPPRDAIEALRQRLVAAADDALKRCERRLRATNITTKDVELARQIARLIREAAAIPGPNEPRPVKPGDKIPGAGGAENGARTRGGLAGQITAAHRNGAVYTPEDDPQQSDAEHQDQGGDNSAAHTPDDSGEHQQDGAPGAWMRGEVAHIAG